jgi:hypothetical protein
LRKKCGNFIFRIYCSSYLLQSQNKTKKKKSGNFYVTFSGRFAEIIFDLCAGENVSITDEGTNFRKFL